MRADEAQVVEHPHGKGEAASASLAIGSHGINVAHNWRAILAQLVERIFRKDEAPGSIPGDGSKTFLNIGCG